MNYPPGPKGSLFQLGNLGAFRRDPLGALIDLSRYGDITRTFFGPQTVYTLHHPDLIHQVLVDDAAKYYKPQLTKQVLKPSVGNGLLVSDGDFWKRQRKLAQPAFHMKRVEAYGQVMVDYTERMMANWQAGRQYDLMNEMMQLTMNIVSKTLFGADVSAEAEIIGSAITVGQESANKAFNHLIQIPLWLPTAENRATKQALNTLNEIIHRFIRERRESGKDEGDLLSMLLMARDEDDGGQMNDQQLRDEAFTLFTAGHETTANSLTWTWYLLAQNPQAEAKLHEELDAVLGGRLPNVADLARLPYTEMVIKEAMRLYPAAWIVGREPIEDTTIGSYPVKKGWLVFISPYSVHRDPRWFHDSDQFIPERFSPENEGQIPRYGYIPFGGGPRVCIGNMFAMMEARLILASVAQRYRLSLVSDTPVVPEPLVTLRPKGGMPMMVEARSRDVDAMKPEQAERV